MKIINIKLNDIPVIKNKSPGPICNKNINSGFRAEDRQQTSLDYIRENLKIKVNTSSFMVHDEKHIGVTVKLLLEDKVISEDKSTVSTYFMR